MQNVHRSLWIVSLALAVVLFFYPINSLPLRLALIASSSGVCVGLIWLFRRQRRALYAFIVIALATAGFLVLPGSRADTELLRNSYLASLRSYEGTRYVWGGENQLGIDCSGLVRAALIKANLQQGIRTLNPKLIRFALSLWWHDCSAQALGEEYRGQTKPITPAKSINTLDEAKVLPGDIAVTASGVHVLAYLGNHEWIEADPHFGKVVIVRVPAVKNPWFDEPVRVMRWTELEAK